MEVGKVSNNLISKPSFCKSPLVHLNLSMCHMIGLEALYMPLPVDVDNCF